MPITPPIPLQDQTDQSIPNASGTQDTKPDGGVLGHAAMGALQGAEQEHNVQLDFSKATPLNPQGPQNEQTEPAAPATSNPSGPVQLDFSKAKPISPVASSDTSSFEPKIPIMGPTGALPEPFADVFRGAGKAALQTLSYLEEPLPADYKSRSTLYKIFHPPLPDIRPKPPEGVAQDIGEIGENVMEFVAGDEALKGLTAADKLGVAQKIINFAEKAPKWASKALDIGLAALRQGTVGGAQTIAKGGTADEAAETGGVVAGTSAAFGALGVAGNALYEAIARRQPQAIEKAFQEAADQGNKLADDIAGKPLGGTKASALEVESQLDAAENQMHSEYSQGLTYLSQEAGDMRISVAGTKLQELTTEMSDLGDLTPKQEVALQVDNVKTGVPFTWDDMIAVRKNISAITRRLPHDSPLLRDLGAMRYAIDDATQSALDAANKPDLANTFSEMRKTYWTKSQAFRDRAVRALTGQSPDSVANVLLSGGSKIESLNQLRYLIGTDAMKPVEGQLLKKLIGDASASPEGFNPRSFIRSFNKLNPDVKKAIWGTNLPEIEKFLQTAQNLPTTTGTWGGLERYMMHRAIFDVALRGAGLGALIGGAIGTEKSSTASGMEAGSVAAIIGALLLFHSPRLLRTADAILQGTAKVATPVVAGSEQLNTGQPQENPDEQNPALSENLPELPEGHVHVKTSNGDEFFLPQEQLANAKQIDSGLQLLREAGQEPSPAPQAPQAPQS